MNIKEEEVPKSTTGDKLVFLFIDAGGLHTDTARKVASEGHKVYYFNPWQSAYAKFEDFAPGVGVPGIEKVLDWAPYTEEADCIVFPDVGMGQLAHWLREKGYTVFGAGLGEEMEQDRIKSVEIMDKFGIKHPETQVFLGIDKAMEFLRGQPTETNQLADGKYFVKFNIWRGSIDSFPVESLEQAADMFAKVRANIGPYAQQIPVIIQTKVEGIECGFDCFFNGEVALPVMWGFESGGNYVGKVESEIPAFQKDYAGKVFEYLKSVNYRGAFSTEVIFDGKDCYLIDWTCRFPMPLGLMYSQFIPNFGDFLFKVASGGQAVTGMDPALYYGVAEFNSENAISDYLAATGNENTKFMQYMMEGDQVFVVPGVSTLGVVTGSGKDFTSLKENLEKNSDGVSAFFGGIDTQFLPTIINKYILPLKEYDISFGEGAQVPEVPTPVAPPQQESNTPTRISKLFQRITV
jgi:hypothetical protein